MGTNARQRQCKLAAILNQEHVQAFFRYTYQCRRRHEFSAGVHFQQSSPTVSLKLGRDEPDLCGQTEEVKVSEIFQRKGANLLLIGVLANRAQSVGAYSC